MGKKIIKIIIKKKKKIKKKNRTGYRHHVTPRLVAKEKGRRIEHSAKGFKKKKKAKTRTRIRKKNVCLQNIKTTINQPH